MTVTASEISGRYFHFVCFVKLFRLMKKILKKNEKYGMMKHKHRKQKDRGTKDAENHTHDGTIF